MRKYRLVSEGEWGRDKINSSLDESVYAVLTEDLPEAEKVEKYSELFSKFTSDRNISPKTTASEPPVGSPPSQNSDLTTQIEPETIKLAKAPSLKAKESESELLGQGQTDEVKADNPISGIFNSQDPQGGDEAIEVRNKTSGVKPPGVQPRNNWREIWINLST